MTLTEITCTECRVENHLIKEKVWLFANLLPDLDLAIRSSVSRDKSPEMLIPEALGDRPTLN
jgi:hypothetical protein